MEKEQLQVFIERLKDSKRILMNRQSFMHEHNFFLERDGYEKKIKTIDVILDQLDILYQGENANVCQFNFNT